MCSKYRINDWILDPQRLTLLRGTAEIRLESRVMQVLLCLIQHADQVVSREMLIDEVWHGGTVSDNAINRIIGLLRQAFGDNAKAPAFIRTVPKKGYVLIADLSPISPPSTTATDPATPPLLLPLPAAEYAQGSIKPTHVRRRYLAWGLLLLMIAGLITWFGMPYRPSEVVPQSASDIMQVKPITFFEGQEIDPALSNDGSKLAFAHRELTDNHWRIRILSIREQTYADIQPAMGGNMRYPAWSADGQFLAFLNWGSPAGCQLVVQSMTEPERAPRAFGCHAATQSTSIAWAPSGNALYYVDTNSKASYKRLFRLNLIDGRREQLSQPHVAGQGDYAIALAPDGQKMAVLRSIDWFNTQILLFDLVSGEWRNLIEIGYPLRSVAWSAQGDAIIYRGEAGQLYRLSLESRQLTRITSVVSEINSPASNTAGQLTAVSGELFEEELWRWQLPYSQAPQRWVYSSRRDYSPAISHDGKVLAFVSNRSGLPQLWLRRQNGQELQLTHLTSFSHINELSFSADNQWIAGTLNRRAFVFDLLNNQLQLPEQMNNVQNLAWGTDVQHLIAAVSIEGLWQIKSFNIANGTQALLVNDAFCAKYDRYGVLYFSRLHKPGIWRLQHGAVSQLTDRYTPHIGGAWQLAGDDLWLLESLQQRPQLSRISTSNGQITTLPIPMANVSYRSLSVSEHGDVILSMLAKSSTDIVSLTR
ncbi:winged helix-turn-helix domain-containing protein [Shewanella sp.]|uniref:winged helix-turn-helix domain-containing protein n=1 Tax=Shewanella sp. TaxID=50422 RepID=UPI003A96FBAC